MAVLEEKTCRSCYFWDQSEWILKTKYTKPENNIQGFCTWKPDTPIPYYLQRMYGTGAFGSPQHRDTEACGCFKEK